MSKHRHAATRRPATDLPAIFADEGQACDDPHDAIDQELLGIWMSISRLRHLIRCRTMAAPGRRVLAWRRRNAVTKARRADTGRKNSRVKKSAPKKSRHPAA